MLTPDMLNLALLLSNRRNAERKVPSCRSAASAVAPLVAALLAVAVFVAALEIAASGKNDSPIAMRPAADASAR